MGHLGTGGGTWRDEFAGLLPNGCSFTLQGCGFFHVGGGKIKLQRGYWDKASWFGQLGIPLPPVKLAGPLLRSREDGGHPGATDRRRVATLMMSAQRRFAPRRWLMPSWPRRRSACWPHDRWVGAGPGSPP